MRAAALGWLVALAALPVRPDTVTKADHLSVNGTLKQMSNGVITLEARYASGPRALSIAMSEVDSIEFNDTTFNPGVPPKTSAIGKPKPTTGADTLVLRGNQRKQCKVASIDQQAVHCTGKEEYSRKITLRILVGVR